MARWGEAFATGVDLFDAGAFFEAHEVWEGLWLAETEFRAKRTLQGLIQVAAGYHKYFTQARRDAAERLLQRGLEKLADAADAGDSRASGGPTLRLASFCAGVQANLLQLAQAPSSTASLGRAEVPSLSRSLGQAPR